MGGWGGPPEESYMGRTGRLPGKAAAARGAAFHGFLRGSAGGGRKRLGNPRRAAALRPLPLPAPPGLGGARTVLVGRGRGSLCAPQRVRVRFGIPLLVPKPHSVPPKHPAKCRRWEVPRV